MVLTNSSAIVRLDSFVDFTNLCRLCHICQPLSILPIQLVVRFQWVEGLARLSKEQTPWLLVLTLAMFIISFLKTFTRTRCTTQSRQLEWLLPKVATAKTDCRKSFPNGPKCGAMNSPFGSYGTSKGHGSCEVNQSGLTKG